MKRNESILRQTQTNHLYWKLSRKKTILNEIEKIKRSWIKVKFYDTQRHLFDWDCITNWDIISPNYTSFNLFEVFDWQEDTSRFNKLEEAQQYCEDLYTKNKNEPKNDSRTSSISDK